MNHKIEQDLHSHLEDLPYEDDYIQNETEKTEQIQIFVSFQKEKETRVYV